jgi:hypothetical protein
MDEASLFSALLAATRTGEVELALDSYGAATELEVEWVPVGGRDNNRGPIEVSADPGRSLVERVTNAIDAVLEGEHERHRGQPDCRTPREASIAWLGVPEGGLSEMTPRQRQGLANRVSVRLGDGDGRDARLVDIWDSGIAIAPEDFDATILSLNESNKIQKHYLAGTYGQGGSSTFAITRYTLIASRRNGSREVGFTVVKFLDLPPDLFKTGHYVYMTVDGSLPAVEVSPEHFGSGTLVRHWGYDLSSYPSPLGPNSIYGLLNQVLFDPVLPIWLESDVHGYRRVIKGSRNALNGAIDEGDVSRRGPTLSHHIPLFYVSLGEFGRVGFEYWVLEAPTTQNKRPSAAFVNPARPIVFTLHGQNHAELHQSIVRKDAELPYLTQRFIGHIDCNALTPAGKRALFASTREEARRGVVYHLIRDELLRILRSDDELERLNTEARDARLRDRDETAMQEMRREVARLLRLHGIEIAEALGPQAGGTQPGPQQPRRPRRPRLPPEPLEVHEPPTFVRIVWDEGEPIGFYPGQRRYVRIETDANSTYHNPDNPALSRSNFIATGEGLNVRGSTPLRGGRMRVIVECGEQTQVGATGVLRVELTRQGRPTLFDERATEVRESPPVRPGQTPLRLPPFEVRPVEGPHDNQWAVLGWPDDAESVASSAEVEDGMLVVYYSTAFPKYAHQRARYEQRNPGVAESFTARYEIWLAAHSLLLHQDQQMASEERREAEEEQLQEFSEEEERQERCRMGTMAALFASREVDLGGLSDTEAAADSVG